MVRKLIWALLLGALLLPVCAAADVIDDADVFTDEEEDRLADFIDVIEECYPSDIVILTSYDTPEVAADRLSVVTNWAQVYYIQHGYGEGELKTGILLLIDMNNDAFCLAPRGLMAGLINDGKLDRVLEAGMDEVANGDLFDGTAAILSELLRVVCEDTGVSVPAETPEIDVTAEAAESASYATVLSMMPLLTLMTLLLGGVAQ